MLNIKHAAICSTHIINVFSALLQCALSYNMEYWNIARHHKDVARATRRLTLTPRSITTKDMKLPV